MPRFVFDLNDIWQDFSEMAKEAYTTWTDPADAPPSIRTHDAAFVCLLDEQDSCVGVFVPELYELARVNGLIAQQQEENWLKTHPQMTRRNQASLEKQPFYSELYTDGRKKSAFELAVLPIAYSDHDKKSAHLIEKYIEKEIYYRLEQGQALPPVVNKYQIISDYLKDLHLIHLKAGSCRSLKLNILNPKENTRKSERAVHYVAQRSAFLQTLLSAAAVVALTPLSLFTSSFRIILSEWCSKDSGLYGLAETLLREIKSNFSGEFSLGDKISLKKLIKSATLVTALGVGTVGIALSTWSHLLTLSLWGAKAFNLGFMPYLKYAIAGYSAFLTGLSTFVGGGIGSTLFLGIRDLG